MKSGQSAREMAAMTLPTAFQAIWKISGNELSMGTFFSRWALNWKISYAVT
jgi:hypothetical protein